MKSLYSIIIEKFKFGKNKMSDPYLNIEDVFKYIEEQKLWSKNYKFKEINIKDLYWRAENYVSPRMRKEITENTRYIVIDSNDKTESDIFDKWMKSHRLKIYTIDNRKLFSWRSYGKYDEGIIFYYTPNNELRLAATTDYFGGKYILFKVINENA